MRDCVNAEFRDRLPDLLHERLDGEARVEVLAHVAACDDCTAELALLRSLRTTLAVDVPAIDVSLIVASLPAPPARAVARSSARTTRRVGSIASLALAAGLGAVMFLRQEPTAVGPETNNTVPSVVAPARAQPIVGSSTSAQAPSSSPTVVAEVPGELALEPGLSEVSDGGLAALLREIESMEALPAVDPEEPLPTPAREDETQGVDR